MSGYTIYYYYYVELISRKNNFYLVCVCSYKKFVITLTHLGFSDRGSDRKCLSRNSKNRDRLFLRSYILYSVYDLRDTPSILQIDNI